MRGEAGVMAERSSGASTVSRTSRERFAARNRARRWLALRPALIGLGLLALLGALAWVVYVSPALAARRIEVVGTRRVSAEEVRRLAEPELGRPLARADVRGVERRVGRLRPVAAVHVVRAWPHTLRVQVTERQVAAVVPDGDRYALVDRAGVRFGEVSTVPPGVPVIQAAAGQQDAAALRGALDILAALPPSILRQVRSVRANTPDDVVLRLSGDVTVRWGSAERSADKATVLAALLRQKGTVYDVSAPDAPAVRRD
ncbi:cell division protein FtsQ/DivIB [Carbonactinospora thermoautotrophica]|uniref:cell division protein FtsQ/DivIB n=2 Tax=Carbonactinospora thermoautotrophica TaxID=1469144 RepID=UPI000834E9E3|nr:FtsQ-type POTRA domain-containing protein [Carbonactinospora thermoautotrophica]